MPSVVKRTQQEFRLTVKTYEILAQEKLNRPGLIKMDLLQSVLNAGGGAAITQLAQKFNLNQDQAAAAVASLLPAIAGGLQSRITSEGGLQNVLSSLTSGQHTKYVDDPNALNHPNAAAENSGALNHILPGQEVHQEVAQQASQQTGISPEILQQMLPVIASLAMGAMSKHVASGNLQNAGPAEQSSGLLNMLGPLLSANAGSLLGMASRIFNKG
jgi:hypothetical protein